jgi:hypothetical protein
MPDPPNQTLTYTQWITTQPEAAGLYEVLLKLGGRRITTPSTIPVDTPLIVAIGGLFHQPVYLVEGKPSRSRANVARMLQDHKITSIGVGWALADDVWHEHTWGVNDAGIVETVAIQDKYFGVTFTGKEAKEFFVRHKLIR